ncbi:MAG: D-alanyl-D-alanine carboxypeptidase [Oscillospiraceae bacterium]|nr:D-alanyl-D-alanine carboxypeptidase [Oscillospiraceae bacterium]
MKRTLSALCLFIALLRPVCAAALEPSAGAALPIAAPSAILMEKETGTVLYEKDADRPQPPASVTKIMTLLLLIEDIEAGRIALDDVVTASARAASFGGSCVYLEEGERMSVSDMLKCIAVVSANDCAVAMAEHVNGTEAVFVERMNRRAEELGMANTHFTNCTGLFEDAEHYSTARDIALMSRALIRHELIKQYSCIWMDSIRGGAFELTNTNKLVARYPGCTGLKTGYTSEAMYCLSATAERDGVEYIAVVLHGESIDSRNTDAATLLNYAFANFALCPLRPGTGPDALPVEMGRTAAVPLVLDGESFAVVPKGGGAPQFRLELPARLSAPVRAGERVGTLYVAQGEKALAEVPILTGADVPRLGFTGIFTKLARSLVGF